MQSTSAFAALPLLKDLWSGLSLNRVPLSEFRFSVSSLYTFPLLKGLGSGLASA